MGFDMEGDDLMDEAPSATDTQLYPDDNGTLSAEPDRPENAPANWMESMQGAPQDVKEGDIRQGVVVAVDQSGVHVDIGAKVDGIIPLSEFDPSEMPKVDDPIEVAVVRIDDENDVIRLSKRRADYERVWNNLEQLAKEHGVVQAMVTERVKGGLRVDVGVPGFVPASHLGTRNVRSLERFVGRTLRLKVLEADRRAKKVILSHRELVEEERARRKAETLARLEEGVICEGKVRNITDYGAFIDLGGVDGLLHVSEMSWTRIKHPSEVVKVGDTVRVVVLEIANNGERISLGMRQILPDPWKEAAAKLRPNTIVKGRITRLVKTGAFATVTDADVEGFIPLRELSEKRISDPGEIVQVGDTVELKILDIRTEARKMTLSLVAAEEERERARFREYMASQVTSRPTLGDQFGEVLASIKTADKAAPAEEAPEGQEAPRAQEAPEPEAAPTAQEAPAAQEAPTPQAAAAQPPAAESETTGSAEPVAEPTAVQQEVAQPEPAAPEQPAAPEPTAAPALETAPEPQGLETEPKATQEPQAVPSPAPTAGTPGVTSSVVTAPQTAATASDQRPPQEPAPTQEDETDYEADA